MADHSGLKCLYCLSDPLSVLDEGDGLDGEMEGGFRSQPFGNGDAWGCSGGMAAWRWKILKGGILVARRRYSRGIWTDVSGSDETVGSQREYIDDDADVDLTAI